MIQRYEIEPDKVMESVEEWPHKYGRWVKYADHAAEVARLSKPSPAVARLVEACKRMREHIVEQWPQGMTCSCGECAWCWETSDVAATDEALAAVEKEMQP